LARGELVGWHLRRYRKHEHFSTLQWKRYHDTHLHRLFRYAVRHSRFHQERLADLVDNIDSTNSAKDVLRHLPFLHKTDLITHRQDLRTSKRFWLSSKTTGGSTGEPVQLLKNPSALARERAATWRSYEWAGIRIGDRQARFWGIPHSNRGRAVAKVTDFLCNRSRISAFDLSEESLARYYRQLTIKPARYLYGYVSAIETLADFVVANDFPPLPKLHCVITTSEVLTEKKREAISAAFGVKVYNEYGCGEVGSIAHECEYGSMHVMADNLIVEIDGRDGTGEIVVTDLFNSATPMIRYRLGDFATWSAELCECGRRLPVLQGIHGRAYDLVRTASGRKIHPEAIMYVFEDIQTKSSAFRQFQVIQTTTDSFSVNIVPSPNWSNEIQSELTNALQALLGSDVQLEFDLRELIPREPSGKMRVVKSNFHDS